MLRLETPRKEAGKLPGTNSNHQRDVVGSHIELEESVQDYQRVPKDHMERQVVVGTKRWHPVLLPSFPRRRLNMVEIELGPILPVRQEEAISWETSQDALANYLCTQYLVLPPFPLYADSALNQMKTLDPCKIAPLCDMDEAFSANFRVGAPFV